MKRMNRFLIAALAVTVMTACNEDDDLVDLPTNEPVEHTFTFIPSANTPEITSINVAGNFAAEGEELFWNPTKQAMTQQADGTWQITVELDPGTYEYKYVFNGDQWPGNMCDDATWGHPDHENKIDPNAATCVDDGFGGANAQLVIESS